jgi:hypothetical protein
LQIPDLPPPAAAKCVRPNSRIQHTSVIYIF